MTIKNGQAVPPRPDQIALRVLRIDQGASLHARMLSGGLGGIFTHWQRGRSAYCDPKTCCTNVHKPDRYWKGYLAVEVYQGSPARWFPWCLEVTEHLELDLRGIYARGQVWRLWRLAESSKKRSPVQGTLVEELDPAAVPKEFAILPVLRTIFHAPSLLLDQRNPMPDRVIVAPSDGAPPPGIGSRAPTSTPATVEEFRTLRKQLDESFKASNGKGNANQPR